jgi:futalosine hydrolase
MSVLLCAATKFEVKPTIDFIREKNLTHITVLITGVGLTTATYQLTKAVCIQKPQLIILDLAKVVGIKNEMIGDQGVEENGKFNSLFDLKLIEKNVFPWIDGKLCNNHEILLQSGLPIVDSVTINEISTGTERIQYYKDHLGADIESMEGAALHYVALLENIPFLQIRSLSNFAGERDKSKWEMNKAISCLNLELQRILLKL